MRFTIRFLWLVPVILFAYFIYALAINIPIYDEWAISLLINDWYSGTLTFAKLLSPHNECRMLYPRLLHLFLMSFTHWDLRVEIWLNFAIFIALFLLIRVKLLRLIPHSPLLTNVLLLLISLIIFSFKQYEDMFMGFAVCHYLSVFTGFLAFHFLEKINLKNLFISLLFAHIATLSYASGFLVWGAIVLMIIFKDISLKHKIQYVAITIGLCLLQLLAYIYQYHVSSNIPHTYHILTLLIYSFCFVSSNLINSNILYSIVFGTVSLLILLGSFWYFWRKDTQKFQYLLPFYAFALVGFLSGTMAAYGRASEGYMQSFTSRYVTLSMPYMVSFLVILGVVFKHVYTQSMIKRLMLFVFCGIVLVMTKGLVSNQIWYFEVATVRHQEIVIAKEAVLQKQWNHPLVKKTIYPYPNDLPLLAGILEKYKLSIYQ
jgi:hypothetical protein